MFMYMYVKKYCTKYAFLCIEKIKWEKKCSQVILKKSNVGVGILWFFL